MRALLIAALLLAGCAATIPGISYSDDPKWDCPIVTYVACGDSDAPVDPISATQCQAMLSAPPAPTINAPDLTCDVNGLVTATPNVRTVALKLRRMHLTVKRYSNPKK